MWKLNEHRSLMAPTDFFTPILDDPYNYGAISAANYLSDVYAIGGSSFLALNTAVLILQLPVEIASEILLSGAEKAHEAGVPIWQVGAATDSGMIEVVDSTIVIYAKAVLVLIRRPY